MNILHLLFSMKTGGIETMLVDIVKEQSLQHTVSVAVINDEIDETLVAKLPANVRLYRINRIPGNKSPGSIVRIIRLNRLIFRNRYDIVHCHSHPVIGLLWPALRKKTVLTLHITDVDSRHFKKYRKIYAISAAVAQDLKKRTGLNAIVVCNGIDVHSIVCKKAGMLPGKKDGCRIVQVGRLDAEKKGQNILIEAIHALKQRGVRDVHADFIGEGDSFDSLCDLVKKRGLDVQVSFLGLRDRTYIYKHLKDYDLLVQPSFVEGFGLTIVESMAAKTPVLVADIEGPMEVIENGKYGICFERGNVRDLAEKLEGFIMGDWNRIAAVAEKAYSYVKAQYSIQQTASSYLKEYARVCS